MKIDWHHAEPQAEAMRMCLSLAVPMRIAEHQAAGRDVGWLMARAKEIGPLIQGPGGEALLYRAKPSKDGPGTAALFNKFADAVACCALVAAGGIDLFGLHFCPGQCARCEADR